MHTHTQAIDDLIDQANNDYEEMADLSREETALKSESGHFKWEARPDSMLEAILTGAQSCEQSDEYQGRFLTLTSAHAPATTAAGQGHHAYAPPPARHLTSHFISGFVIYFVGDPSDALFGKACDFFFQLVFQDNGKSVVISAGDCVTFKGVSRVVLGFARDPDTLAMKNQIRLVILFLLSLFFFLNAAHHSTPGFSQKH